MNPNFIKVGSKEFTKYVGEKLWLICDFIIAKVTREIWAVKLLEGDDQWQEWG